MNLYERERALRVSIFYFLSSLIGIRVKLAYGDGYFYRLVANQLLIGLGFGRHINYYLADCVNNQFLIYLCYKYIMLSFPKKKKCYVW